MVELSVQPQKKVTQIMPKTIQKFLDNAPNGVVYVSLGTIKTLPEDKQKAIINAISQLHQNVLWDTDENIANLPANILCRSALTHIPVLSHKNIVLFVTHGDTIIVKQALHYGIPMLIIPLHNNQIHDVIQKAALENVILLNADNFTETQLNHELDAILNDKKHATCAKEISNLLHKNVMLECTQWKKSIQQQCDEQQLQPSSHLHLDALGALFFVIFVFVKLSLKFCRLYNSCDWSRISHTKKTK